MKFVTVTELKQRATQIISEIGTTGEEVVVTKNGKPVVLMQAVSGNSFTLKQTKEGKRHGRT